MNCYICKKLFLKTHPTNDFEKIQTGDIVVFEKIFREYYQYLCRQAYFILKDSDEAEEIVQETFVKIWNKREDISINTSIKNYLIQTIKNQCLNQIKHEQVRRNYAQDFVQTNNSSHEDQRFLADELQANIERAIDRLPTERKKIFLMSRKEGLKYQEIAQKLNISIKTVENQMGKALKHLREELKEYLSVSIIIFLEMLKNL